MATIVLLMKAAFNVLSISTFALLITAACNRNNHSSTVPEALTQFRAEQDFYFKKNIGSPYYGKADFKGLSYFEFTPVWIVNCVFIEEPYVKIVSFTNTDGTLEEYRVMGKAILKHSSGIDTLEVYKWFLPFYDATNGEATYQGGRYLDVAPPASGKALQLDFNFAYHPMCVHDSVTACPLPPPHNVVRARVEAGERLQN